MLHFQSDFANAPYTAVAIIGGGAAGCFAAANLSGLPPGSVTLFEKTGKLLQKVKVSGGGRCNTTHNLFDIQELITRYPRGKQWLRKTMYQFGPQDTIDWFQQRGVVLKAEADGRMFPDTDSSQTIIDCLIREMQRVQTRVMYHKALTGIYRSEEGFILSFADDTHFCAKKVLVACGGFPKEEQYQWLRNLGLNTVLPVPSLFTFNMPGDDLSALMGVSVPLATIRIHGTKIQESGPLLITHWGLSGPVVLRASAWGARELSERQYRFDASVNWLGELSEPDVKDLFQQQRSEHGKSQVSQKNPTAIPRRLWEFLASKAGIQPNTRWGELTASAQNKFMHLLHRYPVKVSGKTTFKEEFVTCGGIALAEVSPQTMEARNIPGLYFAGEILDVDGITGGFNFQHAWTSGYLAAQSISRSLQSA